MRTKNHSNPSNKKFYSVSKVANILQRVCQGSVVKRRAVVAAITRQEPDPHTNTDIIGKSAAHALELLNSLPRSRQLREWKINILTAIVDPDHPAESAAALDIDRSSFPFRQAIQRTTQRDN